MSMDHWWNDTYGRKPKYLEINLSQSPFVHHKSHIRLAWGQTIRG